MTTRATGRPTINDVARVAGVSRQTVTRAMNDMAGINVDTRARVLTAADQLCYRPSRFGRGLVKAHYRTLGLVLDDLSNPFYPELASALIGSATAAGWSVVIAERKHALDQQRRQLEQIASQVDAVVGYLGRFSAQHAHDLRGLPVVDIDPLTDVPGHGQVRFEVGQAVEHAVEHLWNRGVRRPVLVDLLHEKPPSPRAAAFSAAFARRGAALPILSSAEAGFDDGAAIAIQVLRAHPDVDGVVAFNDLMACGVLTTLRSRGVDVPNRVRVVGVDGLAVGTYVTPSLTSLAVDFGELAETALELVQALTDGAPEASPRRIVQHRLVVREST